MKQSIILKDRTYYLCIENQYASILLREWFKADKETPIYLRAPKSNIENSFVLVIKDHSGNNLEFINKIAAITKARIEVK